MLTQKQLKLLEFIHNRTQKDGVSPSFDEMREALDLRSKSGIHRLITALEERGFIRRLAHRARAIEVTKMPGSQTTLQNNFIPRVFEGSRPSRPSSAINVESHNINSLPMMGRIAAGVPISAIEDYTGDIPVPGNMISGKGQHYALEVKGDSMIDAAICDGDWVVVRQEQTADNGDIVAAMLDEEATVKVFKQRDGHTWLLPQNSAYEPILGDHATVMGKVVTVLRSVS